MFVFVDVTVVVRCCCCVLLLLFLLCWCTRVLQIVEIGVVDVVAVCCELFLLVCSLYDGWLNACCCSLFAGSVS